MEVVFNFTTEFPSKWTKSWNRLQFKKRNLSKNFGYEIFGGNAQVKRVFFVCGWLVGKMVYFFSLTLRFIAVHSTELRSTFVIASLGILCLCSSVILNGVRVRVAYQGGAGGPGWAGGVSKKIGREYKIASEILKLPMAICLTNLPVKFKVLEKKVPVRFTMLPVEISKNCPWNTNVARGKSANQKVSRATKSFTGEKINTGLSMLYFLSYENRLY